MSTAARFAAAYAVLTASHEVADHWIQRDTDAIAKGRHGYEGRAACARHVATYTATQAAALLAADRLLGLGLNWRRAGLGLAVSAVTHYAADRSGGRWAEDPDAMATTRLVRAAHSIGKGGWLMRDPQAGYRIDQAWHKGWIAIAAAVAAA
jgi:hypothetical protein